MSAASFVGVPGVLARGLYRHLPANVRQAIHTRLSAMVQYRLGRLVLRGPLLRARGMAFRRAAVDVSATPLDVRRFNLDFVVTVLEVSGVDYFAIPHDRGTESRVGVPARFAATALKALRSTAADHGVVISTRGSKRRIRDVYWVYRPTLTGGRYLAYGASCRCQLEFWPDTDATLVAPVRNTRCAALPAAARRTTLAARQLSAFVPADEPGMYA